MMIKMINFEARTGFGGPGLSPQIDYITNIFEDRMVNILITDDHDIVRLGTSIVVQQAFPNAHVDQASNFEEARKLLTTKTYQLLILDINMPGGNNIRMIQEVLAIQENLRILVFSSYEESIYALRYIQAGAAGYIGKNSSKEELKEAIVTVLEQGKYMSADIHQLYYESLTIGRSSKLKANLLNKLSNREMDVAKHLIKGLNIAEVSKILNLKSSTVSTYKTRIFEKLQIDHLPDLIDIFRLHDEG